MSHACMPAHGAKLEHALRARCSKTFPDSRRTSLAMHIALPAGFHFIRLRAGGSRL